MIRKSAGVQSSRFMNYFWNWSGKAQKTR